MANLSNINDKFLVTTGGNVLIGQTSAIGSSIFQVTGSATFAGNVALGGGALKTYHSNITSVIALDDNSSIFTRADETYIGQNFYYNSSDTGTAIEAGYSTLLRLSSITG